MDTVGIIAEYDPFHNGHLLHLTQALVKSGKSRAVAVISGGFTQRGEPSMFDKFARAEMAIRAGASLVLELPAFFACAGAETFARGGVYVLESSGITESLCFGVETDDLTFLSDAARIIALEPPIFRESLRIGLNSGLSFARARFQALGAALDSRDINELRYPNNILAIEYLSALLRFNSAMSPVTVLRHGPGHNSGKTHDDVASASFIRKLYGASDDRKADRFVPQTTRHIIHNKDIGRNTGIDNYSLLLHYILLCEKFNSNMKNDHFKTVKDEYEQLSLWRRVDKIAGRGGLPVITDIVEEAEGKRYTKAGVRRHIARRIIGLPSESGHRSQRPEYIRVLGFRRSDADLLSELSKKSSLPVVTGVKDAKGKLGPEAWNMFNWDLKAQALRCLGAGAIQNEASRAMVII